MADKNIPAMMADMVPLADLLYLTQAQNERAASLGLLEAKSLSYEKPYRKCGSVEDALIQALGQAEKEDLIVVAGSLYVVGEARAYLRRQGMIPL
jgi:dihydrofolate synthase/folylpolyglutamate synthase